MKPSTHTVRSLAVPMLASVALLMAGCAAGPTAYSGLAASPKMQPNTGKDARRTPFKYAVPVAWANYHHVMIDPVEIYDGPDAQFGKTTYRDRHDIATYMSTAFASALAKRYPIATSPSPDTLRVKLTLTGLQTTTTFLGQASHFDIGGNVYNGIQAVSGGKSAFGGSVSYAVEIYDSMSNQLLDAYVTKQYPNAMNLTAAFGALGAAKTGVDKGAQALVSEMQ